MRLVAGLPIALTAALHLYIAWFEIFAWTTRGPSVFTTLAPELFPQTTKLAANQGLYNGFLAVGLIWSLVIPDTQWRRRVATCFLLFVLAAGIFAAITVDLRPGLFQIIPSALGLLALFAAARGDGARAG